MEEASRFAWELVLLIRIPCFLGVAWGGGRGKGEYTWKFGTVSGRSSRVADYCSQSPVPLGSRFSDLTNCQSKRSKE